MLNIVISIIVIIFIPLSSLADDLSIRISSFSQTKVTIQLNFKFDKPTVIYHWLHAKSMYPILNYGLFIECTHLETQKPIDFMPYKKVLPKFPHKLDVLRVTEYKEKIKIIPGQNYKPQVLKKGRYTLRVKYDSLELTKYPGGKKITPIELMSNKIIFEI